MKLFPTRLFYGWIVVAAACAITFLGFGSAYTFGSFIGPIQHEFGASRGALSIVFSLAGFLYYSVGLFSGSLADRFGTRYVALIGMVVLGGALILAGSAHSFMQLDIGYGLGIGLGIGCAYAPTVGTVQRWFEKHRGLASGLASGGIGLGTIIMPPFASRLIEFWGWRHAYLILGIFVIILGGGAALLLVNDPRDLGLSADGKENVSVATPTGFSVAEAVKTIPFAGLYLATFLASLAEFIPFVHLVPYALDHHVNQAHAVMLLSIIGLGSTLGRFFLGGVADQMGRELFLMVMFIGVAVSMGIWAIAMGFESLALFAFIFGVFYGGWVAVTPTIVMDYFGGRNVSGIIGVLYTSMAIGTLCGPIAAGHIFDVNHSYIIPIVGAIGTNLVAAGVLALAVRKPPSMDGLRSEILIK